MNPLGIHSECKQKGRAATPGRWYVVTWGRLSAIGKKPVKCISLG